MDRSLLHNLAFERASRWRREGFDHKVIDGPVTDKPASWLLLDFKGVVGQLTMWASGEAEMDWDTPDQGGQRHYDLSSQDDLGRCVDDLEAELLSLTL